MMGDRETLVEFLGRSGFAGDEHLSAFAQAGRWTLAQSLSQILPDGDKEKQLLAHFDQLQERLRAMTVNLSKPCSGATLPDLVQPAQALATLG